MDLSACYSEGVKAYREGKGPESNPYPDGSDENKSWLKGYLVMDIEESVDPG